MIFTISPIYLLEKLNTYPIFQTKSIGNNYLKVENLSPEIENEMLCSAFASFGELESCNVVKDDITGESKKYGIVSYVDEKDVQIAIEQMNMNPCYGSR